MSRDQRRRIELQRPLGDLARMHARAVDGAAEHLLEADDPVPVVEKQAREYLVRPRAQPGAQEPAGMGGARERVAAVDALLEIAGGELDRGLEQRGPGGSDALDGGEPARVEVEQPAQPLRAVEREAREVDRGSAAGTGMDEQREKLRVGQHAGAAGEQLLARPLLARPVGNGHDGSVSPAAALRGPGCERV